MLPEDAREKSVMLAKGMGWEIVPHPVHDDVPLFKIPDEIDWEWELGDSFYHPSDMALAWRVAGWFNKQTELDSFDEDIWRMWEGWKEMDFPDLLGDSNAQATWLDRILELCTKAGLIDE